MSTDGINPDDIDPERLFDELFLDNPHTCESCYARLGRQWELPNTSRVESAAEIATYLHREGSGDGSTDRYYQGESLPDRVDKEASSERYTPTERVRYCAACGHERGTPVGPSDAAPEDADRSYVTVLKTSDAVLDTLDEYGIERDAMTFLETLETLLGVNGVPEKEALRHAVAEAVNAGRLLQKQ